MAYAVIKTGGKQYRVEEGTTLLVERLRGDENGDPAAAEDAEPAEAPESSDNGDAVESKPRRRGRRGGRRRSRAKAGAEATEASSDE